MTRDEIWRRLERTVEEVLGLEELELHEATTAADVEGWDSVSTVEILVALEDEFGIRFRTGEMASLENVGQLVERIQRHLRERSPAG